MSLFSDSYKTIPKDNLIFYWHRWLHSFSIGLLMLSLFALTAVSIFLILLRPITFVPATESGREHLTFGKFNLALYAVPVECTTIKPCTNGGDELWVEASPE
jgi:hypothetical protein